MHIYLLPTYYHIFMSLHRIPETNIQIRRTLFDSTALIVLRSNTLFQCSKNLQQMSRGCMNGNISRKSIRIEITFFKVLGKFRNTCVMREHLKWLGVCFGTHTDSQQCKRFLSESPETDGKVSVACSEL